MKNYSELIIPSLLGSVDSGRVAELLNYVAQGDANNTLRLALYLNGTLTKRTNFAKELDPETTLQKSLSTDCDYRGRKVRFESYDFISDRVTYTRFGGEVRHAFKTEEDAQAWLQGKSTGSWNWRQSESYPFEVWKPAEESTGCTCDADIWPEE